jgi:hypothetical protein
LWSFGIFFPVWVCCTEKNLATLAHAIFTFRIFESSIHFFRRKSVKIDEKTAIITLTPCRLLIIRRVQNVQPRPGRDRVRGGVVQRGLDVGNEAQVPIR